MSRLLHGRESNSRWHSLPRPRSRASPEHGGARQCRRVLDGDVGTGDGQLPSSSPRWLFTQLVGLSRRHTLPLAMRKPTVPNAVTQLAAMAFWAGVSWIRPEHTAACS